MTNYYPVPPRFPQPSDYFNPFGGTPLPPRPRIVGDTGEAVAQGTLAAAAPVPSRDTPLSSIPTPVGYDVNDPLGHRVNYEDKGPSFFGSGILKNIGEGLGYHLLPEEAPGPLSLLPDPIYGVVHDYSTVLDLGITAGAAALAPFTGGGSFIGQAALRGGVRGGLAKGAKFALAPAVHGGFGKRLAVEAGIGLGAVAGGKVGANIGGDIAGTPGSIIGGLAGGFTGGGAVLGALRANPMGGRRRHLYRDVRTTGNQYAYAHSDYERALNGYRQNNLRDAEIKEEHIHGTVHGHATDTQIKNDLGLDLEEMKNGNWEQEPDHGPLSSAFRVGGYLKNKAVGMNNDYNPNTRYGKLMGILIALKVREDQAPRLTNHTVESFNTNWQKNWTNPETGEVLPTPSVSSQLAVMSRADLEKELAFYDLSELSSADRELAEIGFSAAAAQQIKDIKSGHSRSVFGTLDERVEAKANFTQYDTAIRQLDNYIELLNKNASWKEIKKEVGENIKLLQALGLTANDGGIVGMGRAGSIGVVEKLTELRGKIDQKYESDNFFMGKSPSWRVLLPVEHRLEMNR